MKPENIAKYKDALKHLAFRPEDTKGRLNKAPDEDKWLYALMNPYVVDLQKITNSKAFRRITRKMQVWSNPTNPHVRTRITHTMEVGATAVTIADILGLNTDLVAAIATCHDIGHTPFGHNGETFIKQKTGVEYRHEIGGLIFSEFIERKGKGLNLSYETLRGISLHSSGSKKAAEDEIIPQEYLIIPLADKMAFTLSDIKDAIRNNQIKMKDLPPMEAALGKTPRERARTLISALIKESTEKGYISFKDSEEAKIFFELKDWMYENVYYKLNGSLQLEAMECAFNYIQEYFPDKDPIFAFASLTDQEIIALGTQILTSDTREIDLCIREIAIPKKIDLPLDRFPFNPEDFNLNHLK